MNSQDSNFISTSFPSLRLLYHCTSLLVLSSLKIFIALYFFSNNFSFIPSLLISATEILYLRFHNPQFCM